MNTVNKRLTRYVSLEGSIANTCLEFDNCFFGQLDIRSIWKVDRATVIAVRGGRQIVYAVYMHGVELGATRGAWHPVVCNRRLRTRLSQFEVFVNSPSAIRAAARCQRVLVKRQCLRRFDQT